MDSTTEMPKIAPPPGCRDPQMKDSHGNFIYLQPNEIPEVKQMSKKEFREAKKAAKKSAPKPRELKRVTLG
jgi:hypothetical protein